MGDLRRYSLDVGGPKMAYGAGALVDTLVRSGAHQYLEFKALEATLILTPAGLVSVPSSRCAPRVTATLRMRQGHKARTCVHICVQSSEVVT